MRPRALVPVIVVGLASAVLAIRVAADPLPAWARTAAALPADPATPGDPAIALVSRTTLRVDRELMSEVTCRRVIRILTAEGGEAATFRFVMEPGSRLRSLRAWTIHSGDSRGSARMSERAETNLVGGGYTDIRLVAITAPYARPGDEVAVEANWDEPQQLPLYSWRPQPENWTTRSAELEVDLPAGWIASAHGYAVSIPEGKRDGGSLRLVLTDLRRLPEEPASPPLEGLLPRVTIRFLRGAGHPGFDDWNAIGLWYEELSRAALAPSAVPPEICAGLRPDVTALSGMASRVQHDVRYVAVELGMQRWQPDAGTTTWQRRYGDCKDKATLLIGALRTIGIDARPVLVRTRHAGEVDPGTPDPLQFNHVVTALRWPGSDLPAGATLTSAEGTRWTIFDPTDSATPLGYISDQLGGTWGLLVGARGELVRLPPASPHRVEVTLDGRLGAGGDLLARATLRGAGVSGGLLRDRFAVGDAGTRLARVREMLASAGPRWEVDSCTFDPGADETAAASLHFGLRLQRAAQSAGDVWVFTAPLLSSRTSVSPRDSTRRLPLILGAPGLIEERWSVALPEGMRADPGAPIAWEGTEASYSVRGGSEPGRFTYARSFDLRERQISPERYRAARPLLRALQSGERVSVLLRR